MNQSGRRAEEYAVRLLAERGYRILAVNYHSRHGEIDIIARTESDILFIEVKARRQGAMVGAEASVTPSKQRKIIKTALLYLQEQDCGLQPRFDLLGVLLDNEGNPAGWELLEGAFNGDAYEKNN